MECGREGRRIQGFSRKLPAELIKLDRRRRYLPGGKALRTAHCGWYKRFMGIHGPRDRAIDSISAARGRAGDRASVLMIFGLMPVLAGCSSFSSTSSTGTSPATYQPAAAAVPASDTTASMTPYPSRALVDVFTGDSNPPAAASAPVVANAPGAASAAPPRPGMPHPPSTYTASAPPYQTSQTGYNASAGSASAPARPAPVAAQDESETEVPGYASKSLFDVFSK
jgi:hypothetical protein